MLNIEFLKIIAGKIVNGAEQKLIATFENASFAITHDPQTRTIRARASADYDGINVQAKISGFLPSGSLDINFSPNITDAIFDKPAPKWNPATGILDFTIAEKKPGTFDFVGTMDLFNITFSEESGDVHLFVS